MSTETSTVTLPVSDCGRFVAGRIGPEDMVREGAEGELPPFGVIIWYESEAAAKAAVKAVTEAHWREDGAPLAEPEAVRLGDGYRYRLDPGGKAVKLPD